MATDRIRPANDAACLAYQYLHEGKDRMPLDVQQSYVDQRAVPEETEFSEPVPHEHGPEVPAFDYKRKYNSLDDFPREAIGLRRNPESPELVRRISERRPPVFETPVNESVAIDVSTPTDTSASRLS